MGHKDFKGDQAKRILQIYSKLMNGFVINKAEEAIRYGVDERTVQRDIDHIRDFLSEESERIGVINTVEYDRIAKGFKLSTLYESSLRVSEALAICKIILDSRAFPKKDMIDMLDRFINCCVPLAEQKCVRNLIKNEEFHYVEPRHKSSLVDIIWNLGKAIYESRYIQVDYLRMSDKKVVHRKLQPLAIMFSEYYFYLTAFIDDESVRKDFDVINDSFPTIYRMDRIKSYKVMDERYHVPYSNRFEEGEFRKRIQFMYGGKLQKVKFIYKGNDIDSILDRLPTAVIIDQVEEGYIISAEVFGKGIQMWLRSQGESVEIIM